MTSVLSPTWCLICSCSPLHGYASYCYINIGSQVSAWAKFQFACPMPLFFPDISVWPFPFHFEVVPCFAVQLLRKHLGRWGRLGHELGNYMGLLSHVSFSPFLNLLGPFDVSYSSWYYQLWSPRVMFQCPSIYNIPSCPNRVWDPHVIFADIVETATTIKKNLPPRLP